MRGKSQAKNQSTPLQKNSGNGPRETEGSRWEMVFFALFFVTIVFLLGTVARAAAPTHDVSKEVKKQTVGPIRGHTHQSSIAATHRMVPLSRAVSISPSSGTQPSKGMGSYSSSLSNRLNSRSTFQKPLLTSPKADYAFSAALTVETARNLDANADTNYTGTYLLAPTFVYVPAKVSFGVTAIYGREYSYYRPDGKAGDFEDLKYGLRKTWKNGDDFKTVLVDDIFLGIGGFLPTSNSALQRGFRGSYGPRVGVSKKLDRVTLNYVFAYTRGLFDYEKDAKGTPSFPDMWTNVGSITYSFTDSFSMGATAEYTYLIDFENYTTGAQRAVVSADYKLNSNIGLSLGLATIRSTVDLVQQTETFKFYEKESTLAFFDFIVSI